MADRRGKLLLEGLVIVLSILLAFFLEGWRADREQEKGLSQELLSVQRELERNRDLLEAEVVSIQRVLDGVSALLETMRGSDDEAVTVPDTIAFLSVSWNMTLNPSLGAIDALMASGRLALIENPELRLGLAGLRDAIADASEEQLIARGVVTDQLVPLLRPHVDLAFIEPIANEFFAQVEPGTPQERLRNRALESFGTVRIPTSLEVRNGVWYRAGWLGPVRSEMASLALRIDNLIELISLELE